ncbi:MAG: hypothetical protein QF492_03915 [Candidatus Krumholzibacteria bacterium]|nr:hypothetical protein [Candidatus Krumholzibacteria bacterium]MDP6669044.1 hypothetical protein [Candidatus Krumholzibacteria bacterium]MDP6797579.1 hypothetical protein [Candidatus Krumholzibacteria bacterium]MDP7021716.1 hypothetical protein [Candidatus Krumholzibacteria bacterium]
MLRRTLILLAPAFLLGCGTDHGPLVIDSFPAPLITEAQLVSADSVHLAWEFESNDEVDLYRVYIGLYLAYPGGEAADTSALHDSTTALHYDYWDTALAVFDSTLGDTLYRFTYFRVAPVVEGVEELASPRAFPSW